MMIGVAWEVEGVDQFVDWFDGLDELSRGRVQDIVDLLEQDGPALGRPVVDQIKTSKHHNMKELRAGSIRVLFIFDPRSTAVLLLGGDKRGDWSGWYTTSVPTADILYDDYLAETNQG